MPDEIVDPASISVDRDPYPAADQPLISGFDRVRDRGPEPGDIVNGPGWIERLLGIQDGEDGPHVGGGRSADGVDAGELALQDTVHRPPLLGRVSREICGRAAGRDRREWGSHAGPAAVLLERVAGLGHALDADE